MRRSMLLGLALTISGVFPAPARTQECDQIVREMEIVLQTISDGSNLYWAARKNYIDAISPGDGNINAKRRRADAAKAKALGAKAAIAQPFARFETLAGAALTQKCLPEAEIKAKREQSFDLARRVNFDQLPTQLATEGATTTPARRMP